MLISKRFPLSSSNSIGDPCKLIFCLFCIFLNSSGYFTSRISQILTTVLVQLPITMTLLLTLFQTLNLNQYWYSHSTTLILSLFIISTVTWLYFFKPKPQNLPPGPSGLPFFGNLLSLDPDLHTYFAGLAQIHGPIFKLQLGSKLGIVLTSPATAREVLKEHDVVFANRDVPAAGRAATYGGTDIVWTPYGSDWRKLRKVCVVKMLSNTTLDSVYDLRRNELRKTVAYLYGRVGCGVNVGEQVFLTVMNVLTNMMWGGAVEGAERESLGAEFREMVAEMTELLGTPNVSDFFPGLARLDLQGVEKRMLALVPKFDGIFERMIGQRGEEGDNGKKKDFLQFLLNLKDEGGDSDHSLTTTQVKALLMVCFNFLLLVLFCHFPGEMVALL
ncbi:hypothetical protein RJT34_33137 [Clitoria ternatea]|uniref:Uncharacterized protein n=1 Tax=Clitoria ternatea TaxID=43366 RepID=A0AAN9EX98_CLITE